MFLGMPVGHDSCLESANARAIPLFAESVIKKGKDGKYQMEIQGRASELVKDLPLSQRRINKEPPVETKEPITRDIEIIGEAGSAGLIMSNLEYVEKGASDYNVHLPKDQYPVQMIKESIDTLLSKGIIDKGKLQKMTFNSNYPLSPDELTNAKTYITYFLKENFRHPPKIDYTKLTDTNTHATTYSLYVSLRETLQKCSEKGNALSNNDVKKAISAHGVERVR